MDPRKLYYDDRFRTMCAYCGATANTSDHAPSRVLLDDPPPCDLAVVPACNACNQGFSRDEQYFACLVDCAVTGSTEPSAAHRPKVARILSENPGLARRIEACRSTSEDGAVAFRPEYERVESAVLKLARGHLAFEFSEPQLADPIACRILPLAMLSSSERRSFESVAVQASVLPEIGSWSFERTAVAFPQVFMSGWNVVQAGRYRYWVWHEPVITCRGVVSEYLAYEVSWA